VRRISTLDVLCGLAALVVIGVAGCLCWLADRVGRRVIG
jgi:hypothetical protein